jgi:retron-type reverse transcriptase
MPEAVLTTLSHHVDMGWLREAYRRTRKDGASGVDQVTGTEYEQELEKNLASLLERFKSGRYRAPAVRRVYIPKGAGGKPERPIGIPTLEDKILQRAVVMLLTPVYEQDFLDCSYGFRPGRSAHQAVEKLWHVTMEMGATCWVLEVDIKSYFDTVSHDHVREFVRKRVRDGVINRMVGAGAGRCNQPNGWQMAQGGDNGGRSVAIPSAGDTPGGSDIAAAGQHLPA